MAFIRIVELFSDSLKSLYSLLPYFAFVLGSLPPMLSITIFPNDYRIPATVFIVAISLLITGYTSAKLGKAPTKTAMIRNLCIGLLIMGVTYLLGQLFSI